MQGPAGAAALFKTMRRLVEAGGGIALISAYRRRSVATHALGNYESTLNVSGQPRWLTPDDYAGTEYLQIPRHYKRVRDPDPTVIVDVFNKQHELVREAHLLRRDEAAVARVMNDGHIETYTDYESYWYDDRRFQEWMRENWQGLPAYHLEGARIDALRAEAVQLAVLDVGGALDAFLKPLV